MTGILTNPDAAPVARDAAGPAHAGGRLRGAAVAIAVALVAAGSLPAEAASGDPPADPTANRVWAGCKLDTESRATVANLLDDMSFSSGGAIAASEIAFVVVYASNNDNDGQPLTTGGGGFTGPVICVNTADGFAAVQTEQTDDIPTVSGPDGADTVDIRDAMDAFVLRYEPFDGTLAFDIENRICHTTNSNTDCHRVFCDAAGNCAPASE